MIQVRPTPHEIKNTNLNVEIENELYEENRETNFIY
jgi:hypothetical protein